MAEADRRHWDERYRTMAPPSVDAVGPPEFLAARAEVLPTAGRALDLACGPGLAAVWLAGRGLQVEGFDVSPVAVGRARDLSQRVGVSDRCRFAVVDLDDGLPAGPPADVILCHRFRTVASTARSSNAWRLGLLAIAVLSEVGAARGRFARPPVSYPRRSPNSICWPPARCRAGLAAGARRTRTPLTGKHFRRADHTAAESPMTVPFWLPAG